MSDRITIDEVRIAGSGNPFQADEDQCCCCMGTAIALGLPLATGYIGYTELEHNLVFLCSYIVFGLVTMWIWRKFRGGWVALFMAGVVGTASLIAAAFDTIGESGVWAGTPPLAMALTTLGLYILLSSLPLLIRFVQE